MKSLPSLPGRRRTSAAAGLTLAVFGLCSLVWPQAPPAAKHDIRPGPGVTATRSLSDYLPSLAGSPGDSPIFVLEGKDPGATVFVAGGTHANEIAGIVAATIMVEHGSVETGRLIVLPHANNSAAGYTDPRRPGPRTINIFSQSGSREFLYGSRLTHPSHQGEKDPEKYRHPASTEDLEGAEARNLDRAYPGKEDGNLTQRVAWAIVRLLKKESVDVAFDLHESGPDSRLAWMIVANPKNIDTGALAVLKLDAAGIPMKLEPSSETFRGLSHREWGDATGAQAFLFETPNPQMVANSAGIDPVSDSRFPLTRRVGVQLATFLAVLEAYNETAAGQRTVNISGLPGPKEVARDGIGAYLK